MLVIEVFIVVYRIFSDDGQHQLSCNTEKDRVVRKNHRMAGTLCTHTNNTTIACT